MPKLEVGAKLPDFSYDTPFAAGLSMAQTLQKAPKTALVFLRYYGCPLCQYDMHLLAEHYAALTATGAQLLVVLQSAPQTLAQQLTPDALPYAIVCDPAQALYKQFAIAPAKNQAGMVDGKTMLKIAKVTAAGYKHGEYEGNELQLPAAFVVDKEGTVLYAHYGKAVGDLPSPDRLADLLR